MFADPDLRVRLKLEIPGPACRLAGPLHVMDLTNEDPDVPVRIDQPVRIVVTDILDLHSVLPRDAKPVVEEYLLEARRLGFRALRIIHGRGIGVQRDMVRKVLARTEFVVEYCDAPMDAGGRGATVVTLRG